MKKIFKTLAIVAVAALGFACQNEIDEQVNMDTPKGAFAELTKPGAKVRTFVIPTNEEYMIALDTLALATK